MIIWIKKNGVVFSYYNNTENYGKYEEKKVGVAGLQPTLTWLQ